MLDSFKQQIITTHEQIDINVLTYGQEQPILMLHLIPEEAPHVIKPLIAS